MTAKLVSIKTTRPLVWHTNKDGAHVLTFDSEAHAYIELDGKSHKAVFKMFSGYKVDGLSVPCAFRWFLKTWDDSNELYNLAGALHDWLYATKGAYYVFKRSECDDIFRGILREAGKDRLHASAACWAVGKFAGGDEHWGNDCYNVKELCRMEIR